MRLLKFSGILLLCGHICACAWFLVIDLNDCMIPADQLPGPSVICGCDPATTECQEWNWFIKYDAAIYLGNSTEARYLVSVYYAIVTLTTLGYGDVLPTNQAERGVASAFALLGALAFSFLISNIGSLVSKGNAIDTAIDERLAELSDLCATRDVPHDTHSRSRRVAASTLSLAPHLLADRLSLLPRACSNELLDAFTDETLGRLPLFRGMSRDCRARLAAVLRPCAFPPGAEIFRIHDAATELYWVLSGEVDLCDVGGVGVGRVGAGGLVGAAGLFPDLFPGGAAFRLRTARARVRCELLELQQADLEGLVRRHMPDLHAAIRRHAAAVLKGVDMRAAEEAMAMVARARCQPLEEQLALDTGLQRALSLKKEEDLRQESFQSGNRVHPLPPPQAAEEGDTHHGAAVASAKAEDAAEVASVGSAAGLPLRSLCPWVLAASLVACQPTAAAQGSGGQSAACGEAWLGESSGSPPVDNAEVAGGRCSIAEMGRPAGGKGEGANCGAPAAVMARLTALEGRVAELQAQAARDAAETRVELRALLKAVRVLGACVGGGGGDVAAAADERMDEAGRRN